MRVTILDIPIPIIVIEKGVEIEGIVLYIESGGPHSNDIWTVAHAETGKIRHYTTRQLKYPQNQTFNITSNKNEKKANPTSRNRKNSRNGNAK